MIGIILVASLLYGGSCQTDEPFLEAALPSLQSALNNLATAIIAGVFSVLTADDQRNQVEESSPTSNTSTPGIVLVSHSGL
jgi:hypothetical protein